MVLFDIFSGDFSDFMDDGSKYERRKSYFFELIFGLEYL